MKLHLMKLPEHPKYATDGAGFLWKLIKDKYVPLKPVRNTKSDTVYFKVYEWGKTTIFHQEDLEKQYLEAVKHFVEERT